MSTSRTSELSSGSAPAGRPAMWHRPNVVAAALALVFALAVAGIVLGRGNGDHSSSGQAAATTSGSGEATAPGTAEPTPADEPSPPPGTPVADDGRPPVLPAVDLDQPVVVQDITGRIVSIEAIDGRATSPGDVAGPALRVTVQIVNDTQADVSLDEVSVNVFHGAELTPAPLLDDPSRAPFTGALAPRAVADGVYVFRVPEEAPDTVTVEVGYRAGAPLAQFTGAAR